MKKILLTAVIAICSLTASAQVWVGGSFGFDYRNNDNGNDITAWGISPTIGYTINDTWAVGVEAVTQFVSVEDGDNTSTWAAGPFARYTFARTGMVSFFVDGAAYIGTTNAGENYKKLDDSRLTWGVGVVPGVKLSVSDKIDLVAMIGYLGYADVEDSHSTFGFGANGNKLELGLYVNF